MKFNLEVFKDRLIDELKNSDVVAGIVEQFKNDDELRSAIFREYFLVKFNAKNLDELADKLEDMTQDERNAFQEVRIGEYDQRLKDIASSDAFKRRVGYLLSTTVLVALAAAISAAASGLVDNAEILGSRGSDPS